MYDFHLVTNWRVLGTVEEVYNLISHVEDLPRWWPAGFPDVLVIEQGDASGVGTIVRIATKGFLPYTLRWHMRVTEAVPNTSISIKAWGDFEGEGVWTFVQNDAWCDITYDWQVSVKKGVERYLSLIARPLVASNHNWVMARGEESLRIELANRHAANDVARSSIPAPPAPKTLSPAVPLAIGASILGILLLRGRKKDRDGS
jgi:hypothetical protein